MLFKGLTERRHNHIRYFRTLHGVIGMLRDPESTESVFDIEDGLRDLEAVQLATDHVMAVPEIRALAEERYLQPVPDVAALLELAPGTLGFHYAHHLRTNGFDPDYYRKIEVQNDTHYLALRMRQTHDIWHVVTGLSADAIGELAVKACELAQTRRPMAAVITAGGVLRYLVKDPDELPDVMEALFRGYEIGRNAKPLLGQKWEEMWARPLASIRTELGVNAGDYLPGLSSPVTADTLSASASSGEVDAP